MRKAFYIVTGVKQSILADAENQALRRLGAEVIESDHQKGGIFVELHD